MGIKHLAQNPNGAMPFRVQLVNLNVLHNCNLLEGVPGDKKNRTDFEGSLGKKIDLFYGI